MLARSQIVLPAATMVLTWDCSAGLMLVKVVPVFVVNGTWRAVFSSSWNCPPVLAQVSWFGDALSPESPPPTPQAARRRVLAVIKVKKRCVFIVIAFSGSR
ncbi:hypothetical protein Ato02nite_038300 [Paractinoplanes toevensis]|uniref:Uncharacterized protein n=1 Tax=Paractinoplanes toevensis TaxID=571911 RepID=A0A919TBJ5_9ACTN|nr:hypothetical protein Ato02nite_038300 [Actinoplanes toevensis]